MLRDQLGRQREVEIAEREAGGGEGVVIEHWPAGKILPWPLPRRERAEPAPGRAVTAADKALDKLGLVRDIDLALHLPLRYEDETRVVPIAALHDGETGQVEGVVSDSRIQFRPRRQLVVTLKRRAGDDLVLRFLHFYPSQQKTLAVGKRVRVRGEARGGFFGLEMVHPSFKVVAARHAAADRADAGLPEHGAAVAGGAAQGRRRRPGARRPRRDRARRRCCRRTLPTLARGAAPPARAGARASTPPRSRTARIRPGSASSSTSCWRSSSRSCRPSASASAQRAPRVRRRSRGGLHDALLRQRCRFALTAAQRRVAAEIAADLARAVPMHRLLQGDVGSGKTVVAALAAARRDRRRLAVRADGADRDPRRAAPEASSSAGSRRSASPSPG